MKVNGGIKPNKFSVEEIPNRKGWCLCRFYENVVKHDENNWTYDEYHLEQLGAKSSLETDINGNYDVYFQAAKATEAPSEIEKLRADVDFILALEGMVELDG